MRSFGLQPQDGGERLNGKHQRKDNLICHSERSEESYVFIKFLTRRIIAGYLFNIIFGGV
jgi:hypothetical protein